MSLSKHKKTLERIFLIRKTEEDIQGYFEGEKLPLCPAGGTYDLATVGEYPSCDEHGCYIDDEEEKKEDQ